MLYFENDYAQGAHEKVLEALANTNMIPAPGYGADRFCSAAIEKIRAACGCADAEVRFLVGGTQTNQFVIDSLLKPYEGVIACTTGHINGHESGAIEYTGHKVLALPHHNGKLCANEVDAYIRSFYEEAAYEHMVFPGMVYISHPTEYGTLYSLEELRSLSAVCRAWQIPLFLDGARLGYGLMCFDTNVTLKDIAALTDVFYIGGTKVGALCGEAVVYTCANKPSRLLTRIKQHGALLAKGRLLGVQFDALFTDDLYFKISRHAICMAQLLKQAFAEKGYDFHIDSPTNQQFVILDDEQMARIGKEVVFSHWEKLADGRNVVRFATSWATTEQDIAQLKQII